MTARTESPPSGLPEVAGGYSSRVSRVLSNRYLIGSLIGSGGSARVYEGRDLVLDRPVAVKMLNSDAAASNDPAGRDRFLGEAKSAACFNHIGSVAIFDAGESDGELFIVMELVDGTSVARLIATDGPMPEAEVVRIGTQLLEALGTAHAAGLVHRDVKPANVLVDRKGNVKLADFGIAKRFDALAESLTTDGMVVGSPRYLAPEQAAGRVVTPAADQYAVGVLLYEMLAGTRPPAPAASDAVGPDVRAERPDVSDAVATAISRALAPCPERRFSSAMELAASLRAANTALALAPAGLGHSASGATTTQAIRAGADAGAATAVMPRVVEPPPDAPPTHEPAPVAPTPPSRPAPAGRRSRPWWMLAVAVAVVLVVGLATLASSRDPSISRSGSPAGEQPAVTESPSFPTTPPGTELIPGFPSTDDIEVFIAQLRDGRDVVGKQSKKLGDGLRKALDADGEARAERAERLAEDLREWVDEGDIDPTVAGRAFEFLALLGAPT